MNLTNGLPSADERKFQELCSMLGLGSLDSGPVQVFGGLLHRMFRVGTTQGQYAVKRMNPEIMGRPGVYDNFRRSERIAQAAYQAGIPAVCAIRLDGEFMHAIDGDVFMVFEWVEGVSLPPVAASPEQCRRIGSLVARIHRIDMNPETKETSYAFSPVPWESLAAQGAAKGVSWSKEIAAAVPDLEQWTMRCNEAIAALQGRFVASHRDMDQKNVLWRDERTPQVIDWEAAGYANPAMDLVDLALNWGGLASGQVERESFEAVIQGYLGSGGSISETWEDAVYANFAGRLEWLEYNMKRSIGIVASDEEERQLGIRETEATLAALRLMADQAGTWCSWLRSIQ